MQKENKNKRLTVNINILFLLSVYFLKNKKNIEEIIINKKYNKKSISDDWVDIINS